MINLDQILTRFITASTYEEAWLEFMKNSDLDVCSHGVALRKLAKGVVYLISSLDADSAVLGVHDLGCLFFGFRFGALLLLCCSKYFESVQLHGTKFFVLKYINYKN